MARAQLNSGEPPATEVVPALQGLVNAQYGAAAFALVGVGVALWLRPPR